jgi:ABC-type nitrate/sulfonate/bicarbonate transport system substrate-binding protein
VTGSWSAPIASLDDLAGKEVHVRKSSGYHQGLLDQMLNRYLKNSTM